MSEKMDPANITAAILAGGLGTRLQSVVSDRPKVLADVAGTPFLERIFSQLSSSGVKNAVLCTGHLASQVEAAYGSFAFGLNLFYSVETSPLGTGGAIAHALPHLANDPVLVLNGDSYCGTDLAAFIKRHADGGSSGSLLLVEMEDAGRYGKVLLESNGRIASFVEKGQAGPGLINAGIYLLAKSLLQQIPQGVSCSLEREMFPRWVNQGALKGFPVEATSFIDIGTPESYETAKQLFGNKDQ